jgi:Ran GTPase-activating protein (RanGAP) involved in mRNA processing and transport
MQLSKMLADIILDSSALHTLSLADNQLDDTALVAIMEALKANDAVALQHLDLAGNRAGPQVMIRRLCGLT